MNFETKHLPKIACDLETGANSYLTCDRVQEIEFAENGYTVTWLPGVQDPEYYLAPFGFYPAHRSLSDGRRLADVPAREWASLQEIKEKPMGVGPYVLTEWEYGKRLTFEANPYYYAGPPKMKRIIIELAETKNLIGQLLVIQTSNPPNHSTCSPQQAHHAERGKTGSYGPRGNERLDAERPGGVPTRSVGTRKRCIIVFINGA